MENAFGSSKKLLWLWRCSIFFFVNHCFSGWSKINLKVYDVINFLNKNLITHFVWYLEKEKKYNIDTLSVESIN